MTDPKTLSRTREDCDTLILSSALGPHAEQG